MRYFEALEPRILFDAAPVAPVAAPSELHVAASIVVGTATQDTSPSPLDADASAGVHASALGSTKAQEGQRVRHEVLFVDGSLPDAEGLSKRLAASAPANVSLDVQLLSADRDGLSQIAEALPGLASAGAPIEAIHIVSHAEAGTLRVGAGLYMPESLAPGAGPGLAAQAWSPYLAEGADILLYGCSLAHGPQGLALVQRLADATGADVAASTNLTGGGNLGGDWVLEHASGAIQTVSLADPSYVGLLPGDGFGDLDHNADGIADPLRMITWNVIGLDSNKPETSGPDTFMVGLRVETDDVALDGVTVRIVDLDGVDLFGTGITIGDGDGTIPSSSDFDDDENNIRFINRLEYTGVHIDANSSKDFYFNVNVLRKLASQTQIQPFRFDVFKDANGNNQFDAGEGRQLTKFSWLTDASAANTPLYLYVEKYISQARNDVKNQTFPTQASPSSTAAAVRIDGYIDGSGAYPTPQVTLFQGSTLRIRTEGETATQGYPQLTLSTLFDTNIFQIDSTRQAYDKPITTLTFQQGLGSGTDADGNLAVITGDVNTSVYANPAGWNPATHGLMITSAPPKAGGAPIVTDYVVRVTATGSGNLSTLILDNSGSSFHYNADLDGGIPGIEVIPFTAVTGSIIGTVKEDTNGDGVGDSAIAGVQVTLTGTFDDDLLSSTPEVPLPAPLVRTTDAQGRYVFRDLQPGTYVVNEGATPGFGDIGDTDGVGNGANTVNVILTKTPTIASAADLGVTGLEGLAAGTLLGFQRADFVEGRADLLLTKTANTLTPQLGGNLTFTLKVTNTGPATATGVQVKDFLPTGLTFVSDSGDGSTSQAGGVVTWDVGTLAKGASANRQIVATVNTSNPVTNFAEITASGAGDPDSTPNNDGGVKSANEDDEAAVTVDAQEADLSLSKTVSNSRPNVGDNITFTLLLNNVGPDAATNVAVKDALASNLSFVSSTSPTGHGSYDAVTGVWTVGTVASGTTATLTITATVRSDVKQAAFTNFAEVSATDQFDPDSTKNNDLGARTANEDDEALVTVTPRVGDLSLSKVVDNTSPDVGQNVVFTVLLTNAGTDTAFDIQVTDNLPAGLTFVSSTGTGSFDNGTGLWDIASLAAGQTATRTITATVTQSASITNLAFVSRSRVEANGADLADPDSVAGNNAGTDDFTDGIPDDDEARVTIAAGSTDLSLFKTVDNPNPTVNTNVVFTLTVVNSGPKDATGVVVKDQLPAGLSFVSVVSVTQGTYDSVSGNWSVGSLANGALATLKIQAKLTSTGSVVNNAEITASSLPDPDSSVAQGIGVDDLGDGLADDDEASVTVSAATADLSLSKSVSNSTPTVGSNVDFTLILLNSGPFTATNVVVKDVLPTGTTFVSAAASQGAFVNGTGLWTVGTVANGGTATLTITATVTSSSAITNTAEVQSVDQGDPDSTPNNASITEDDFDSVQVTPQSADLSLTKTVDDPNAGNNTNIVFTVTVTNSGPNDATGVEVKDTLPGSFTVTSTSTTQGATSTASGVITWTVGNLGVGSSQTLTINGTKTTNGSITNSAEISASSLADPDSSVTQGAGVDDLGDGITDDDEASVVVDTTNGGIADVSLSFTNVSINSGAKSISSALANGDTVVFTLVSKNDGPSEIQTTENKIVLPSGLTFVSATTDFPRTGTFSGGIVTIDPARGSGKLASGASTTITVSTTVNSTGAGTTMNVDAFWSASNKNDPDSSVSTNSDLATDDLSDGKADDDEDRVTVGPQTADLELTKSVSNASPALNDKVTFTLTLTNKGPNPGTNIEVKDTLPAGLTFVTSAATVGSFSNGTGVWTVGDLGVNGIARLNIVATVTSSSAITNFAQVSAVDQADPDSTKNNNAGTTPAEDDEAAVRIVAGAADLTLLKTVDNAAPNFGDNVTFTLTVRNFGPNSATGVFVTDVLPSGLLFQSAVPSVGTFDSGTGVWNVGTVANGAAPTLSLVAKVDTAGVATSLTNLASITASGTPDPDSDPTKDRTQDDDGDGNVVDDDEASATVTVQTADLSLTKTANNASPTLNEVVTFSLRVINSGPNGATNVTVKDSLPAGIDTVTFVSSTVDGVDKGAFATGTGVWTIGSIPIGGVALLNFTGRVITTSSFVNYAEVTASDQRDPDSTPNNDLNAKTANEDDEALLTITPVTADLSLTKGVDNASPNVGDTVTFTLTAVNSGPNTAFNVVVNDQLPALSALNTITFVSSVVNGANLGTFNVNTGVWDIGTLGVGSATLTFTGKVVGAVAFTNMAQIVEMDAKVTDVKNGVSTLTDPDSSAAVGFGTDDLTDGIPDDDEASVSLTPVAADLSLSKSVSNASPSVNATVTFTLTVVNSGPNDATGVIVTDQLPAGLDTVTFGSSTVNGVNRGTFDTGTGVWNIGDVANGGVAVLTFTARVTTASAISNFAQVTATNQADPDSTKNNDVGQTADEDDEAKVTIDARQADLSLVKTVDNAAPNVGDRVVFTLTVTNGGPDAAGGVTVKDLLPAGLTFVSDDAGGAFVPGTGIWTVGTLGNGLSASIKITATVTTAAAVSNFAQVTASDLFDPDSTPNNDGVGGNQLNVTDEDDEAAVTVDARQADLSLAKSVSVVNKLATDGFFEATWTLTLNNSGGSDPATGVQVSDPLPSALTFVSASGDGTYDAGTGLWSVGTVNGGATKVINLLTRFSTGAAITNFAQVSSSSLPDPDSTPNNDVGQTANEDDEAAASTDQSVIDLSLIKRAEVNDGVKFVDAEATSSDAFLLNLVAFRYTITLSNAVSMDTATSVTVLEQVPAGFTLVSVQGDASGVAAGGGVFTLDGGPESYDSTTGIWTVGSVAAGTSQKLVLVGTIGTASQLANQAEVKTADQPDRDSNPATGFATDDLADGKLDDDEVAVSPGAVTITGKVQDDHEGFTGGQFDSADLGIAGVTVKLFKDANGDGTFETLVASTTTDSLGNYAFTAFADGSTFAVQEIDPAGVVSVRSLFFVDAAGVSVGDTTDPGFNFIPVDHDITTAAIDPLVGGNEYDDKDFLDLTPFSISGSVFTDNGTTVNDFDGSDTGLSGVTVSLRQRGPDNVFGTGDDVLLANATTAVNGSYSFTGLTSGVYQVRETNLAGFNDVKDVDATTGQNIVQVNVLSNHDGNLTNDNATGQNFLDTFPPFIDLDVANAGSANFAATFSTGGAGVNVTNADAAISDTDDVNMATFQIVAGGLVDGADEKALFGAETFVLNADRTANVAFGGTTFQLAYTAATTTFNISNSAGGEMPKADLNLLLRGMKYQDTKSPLTEGARTFTFTTNDGGNNSNSPVSTITTIADLFPQANPDLAAATEGGPTVVGNVLANDNQGDAPATVTLANQGGNALTLGSPFATAAGGSLTLNANGSFSYTPPAVLTEGGALSEVFNYTIADVDGDTSSSTLTITVDRLPLAVPDVDATTAGGAAVSGNVIDNDDEGNTPATVTAANQGGNAITFGSAFATAGGGSLTLNGNGTFNYTPPAVIPAGALSEVFNYTITDADGDTSSSTLTITVEGEPNYAITKSDGVATATPGDGLTYTLTVTNVGNQGGTGVAVTDTLPSGIFTNVVAQNGGVFNAGAGTITWDLAAIAGGGASKTVTFTATVLNPSAAGVNTFTNTATVTDDGANGTDPNLANNTASDTDTLNAAPDYAITKSDGVATATPGEGLTYTLTVTNVGNQGGTGVAVTDTLPAGIFTNVVAQNGGVFNAGAGTITWDLAAIAGGGASKTVTFTATVLNPSAAGVNTFTNTATVTDDGANGTDPNLANNTASDTDTLNAAPDYAITKSDGVATATPGDGLTYTLTVTNVGNQGGTGVAVTDTLPAGIFTNVVAQNGGVFDAGAGTITWDLAAIAGGGASKTVTFTATVLNPTPTGVNAFTNTASVTDDGANGADPNLGNNTASDTDSLAGEPDYSITKSDGVASAAPGDGLTYTLTVTNAGNRGGSGVAVTDTLPAGIFTNVVAQNGGVFNAGAGTITWDLASIGGGGASKTVTFTATVVSPAAAGITSFTNTATVTDDGANGTDPNLANNTASDTDTLNAAPDYALTKSDGVAAVVPGDGLTYTLTVTNVGNQGGTGVAVTDTLPAGIFTNVVAQNGGVFNAGAGTITWDLAAIAGGGASKTVTFTATVLNPSAAGVNAFTNTATVADDGANGADPNLANNTARDTDALIATPDYSITKTDGVTAAAPGDGLTYTLTVTNVRNQGGTGVTVTDTLPTGIFTNVVAQNGGVFNAGAGTITWDLGELAGGGASKTVTFTATVLNPVAAGVSSFKNTATVTDDGANGADPNLANNTASDTDTLNAAPDYAITKTDGVGAAAPGDGLTYTLTVTNVGNQGGTGVAVTDNLPTGIFTNVVAQNGGVFNAGAGTITWDLGAIAGGGASKTVTFTATVVNPAAAGVNTFTNTATVTDDGANGADPNLANNTASDTDTLNAAPDYSITKTDGVGSAAPGDGLTYTLTVANLGNQGGTGVTVTDALPSGIFTNVVAQNGGVVNAGAGTITWDLAAIAGGGASKTVTFTATVLNPAAAGVNTFTNTATVTDDGANGTDPNLANNTASDTDTLNAAPDYALTKSDGVATATPGDGLTYTLTVTNIGNQGGTGVTVTDVLPSGIFTNVVAQNGGVVNAGAGTITWDLGAIAGGGATKSVTFTATVGNPAAAGVNNFTNTATVADDGANGADPNLANNTGSDTDTLNAAPDYSITKSDGVATAAPGGGLTYTLTVTNVGNQGGTGVVVTDVLPSGIFTNVVAQNGGVFDAGAGTITWALGSIAGGASTSVTFTASVVTPVAAGVETFTNTATVTDDGANGADPNGANNTASDTDTLLATPDYSIAKSDGVAATTPGGALTYTITVTNVGNQGGTGVVVTDVVPVNALTNIAAQNGGVFNAGAGTITWNLGALAGGASTSVTYTASVLTPAAAGIDTITNVATVADDGANGADPNAANNTASDTDTLNAAPDYAIAKSDGVASAAPGGGLTYTITVTNVGNQGGTGVVITDLVPVNVLGSIVAQNGGVFNAGAATITWNVGALAGGASTTVTYTASVLNPAASGLDSFTNTASVTDDGANGADPNAANNTASDTDALNAAPDYSLAKSDGVAVAAPGGGLTYTLTLTNVGNQGGTGIVVTDTLPVGLFTNVVAQNGGVVNAGAGTITWNVGALAGGGASTVVTFTATVVTPATAGVENFTNTATVADDGANGADPNAANNTATDTDTLHAAPDYAIAKTDNRATAAPGDALTYTITVTNVGNQGGTGVVVTDVVPVNALTNIVAQNGGVFNAGTGTITWNLGALAGGASSAVTYTATVITPAAAGIDTIANTATVADDGANGADPNAANNSVTDTDALDAAPDYSIVKSDGVAAAAPGGALTYTITVTNVGNQGGTGVVITDLVPTNVLTNIVAQNGGLFNEGAGTITWNLGALAGGASTTVTYTATVKSSVAAGIDAFTNTANATDDGANGADPNAANNTASDTDALNAAPDYSIAKSDGVATAAPGNALTYTLTITNVGNQDGTGVVVVDTFPTQVLESVVAANGGIVNAGAGTITWNLGALAAGASTTVTFTTNVKTPVAAGIANFTNNVTVTDDGANGADPNAANNAASDTDNLNAAPDYQITKTDNRAVAAPGDALTYTLVVTNVGNQDGTGVVVQDTFPTSVLAGVVAQNGGIVNAAAGTITWNVGALAGGGGSVTLTFTTTVTNPALAGINDFTNTVSATDDGANGADPNAANNTATDTDVLDALPDYRLTKTDNLTDVQAGQTVTYTVKVENLGNQGGTGVVVVDSFEPTFAGVSASDGGIVDATARTVTWNVGALPAGESRTFTVSGTVSTVIQVGIAAVTNTVVVTDDGQNGVDPNLADNRAEDADLITIRRNDVLPDNTFTSTRRPPEPFPVLLHLPLLPDMSPIYSGAADPGSVLEFAVQNSRGDTVGRQTVQVDAGGNWQVTFAVISLVEYDFSFGAFLAPDPRAPQPSQNRDLFESADVLFLDSGRGRTTKHAILDGPHELSIVQHPSLIDPGAPSGMNLRTYFAPAFNSGVFTYAPPGLEAVLSRAVVEVMARGNSNPLRVGFISYSAEFLCQSWIPTGG